MFTYITPKRLLMIVCTLAVMIGGVFWYSSNPRFATDSSPCKEGERYVTRVMGGWKMTSSSDPLGLCIANEELKDNLVHDPTFTDKLISFLKSTVLQQEANAAGNTYYVATNGNDGSTGSNSSPFRTIQRGVNAAQAGDTVVVKSGTYYERVVMPNSGTSANPITLQGESGAIIDGNQRITGWQPAPEIAPGVYKKPMSQMPITPGAMAY